MQAGGIATSRSCGTQKVILYNWRSAAQYTISDYRQSQLGQSAVPRAGSDLSRGSNLSPLQNLISQHTLRSEPDPGLTNEGRRQCERARELLEKNIDAGMESPKLEFVSTLLRTVQTLESYSTSPFKPIVLEVSAHQRERRHVTVRSYVSVCTRVYATGGQDCRS